MSLTLRHLFRPGSPPPPPNGQSPIINPAIDLVFGCSSDCFGCLAGYCRLLCSEYGFSGCYKKEFEPTEEFLYERDYKGVVNKVKQNYQT